MIEAQIHCLAIRSKHATRFCLGKAPNQQPVFSQPIYSAGHQQIAPIYSQIILSATFLECQFQSMCRKFQIALKKYAVNALALEVQTYIHFLNVATAVTR